VDFIDGGAWEKNASPSKNQVLNDEVSKIRSILNSEGRTTSSSTSRCPNDFPIDISWAVGVIHFET
jgi:hypothetical protein